MAAFYLDHDIDLRLQEQLERRGHDALTTRDARGERARDPDQLLRAARAGRVLVTHNGNDFKLLQEAWRLWPGPLRHAGVLVPPQQRWTPDVAAAEIDRFVRTGVALADELYLWTPSRGWTRYAWD